MTWQQALLDMWAAVHTSEAADAACVELQVEPPSLLDDVRISVRYCYSCRQRSLASSPRDCAEPGRLKFSAIPTRTGTRT